MKIGKNKKKTSLRSRQRRTATNTVAQATPTQNVYSYTSRNRNERPEPRRKTTSEPQKRPFIHNFLAKGSSGLIFLGVVAVTIYLLSLSSSSVLVTEGNSSAELMQVHDSTVYASAVQQIIGSSLWNRNKVTIRPKDIQSQIEQKFPELESVNVVVPFLSNRPVVYIEPAQPALVLAASNGSYVLDGNGKVLIMQSNLPPSIKLSSIPVVTDQSSLRADLNKQALTKNDIDFIRTVLAQLNAKQVKYDSVLLPAGANELDVHIAGQPYSVKFNLQNYKTGREQAGTFLAALQQLTSQQIVPSQYIDVRLEGRAYYK